MIDLKQLNQQQKEAVEYTKGPLLIMAGAGSGKTRVITYKIAYLASQGLVDLSKILAVTFTKKAANEMLERVKELLEESGQDSLWQQGTPFIGTFHSFGAYILRRFGSKLGLDSRFSIYDTSDQAILVKKIMKDMDIGEQFIKPKAVLAELSKAKQEMIAPEDYFSMSEGSIFNETVSKVYKEYSKRLKALNALDFNDLITLPNQLFQDKEVLDFWQNRYSYVLVDEYQDTNTSQYKIIKALVNKHRKICAVGDEDQSIYAWRGANIENIRYLQRDFPELKTIKLERNYRSTQTILSAANEVIARNPDRIPKKLWTDIKGTDKIKMFQADTPEEEAMYLVTRLAEFQKNSDLKDVAVLYRINALSRVLEDTLVRFGVPYKIVGGVGFYDRLEVKDLLAYLMYLHNASDEVSLLRIINTPARKIGAATINKTRKLAIQANLSLAEFIWNVAYFLAFNKKVVEFDEDLIEKITPPVKKFVDLIKELLIVTEKESVAKVLDTIISQIKYSAYLKSIAKFEAEFEERLANVDELLILADKVKMTGFEALGSFLENIALVSGERVNLRQSTEEDFKKQASGVTLMTIHAAKGLEFDKVFLVGLEEGIFPHSRSYNEPNQMAEERRLCYVAITRAKKQLYISFSNVRNSFGGFSEQLPSRFLEDIPEDLVEVERR